MNSALLQHLKQWRMQKAKREGVELFRVLSNKTLEELAEKIPSSMSEMLLISGIKEKKFQRYGHELLALIAVVQSEEPELIENDSESPAKEQVSDALSVSQFLDSMNDVLRAKTVRVQGEVSSVDIRGSYLFFSLKDAQDSSMIQCFMWAREYALSGVKLEEGLEIIINGHPEIYKPTGRFTLRAASVELVGEGMLKKAYDTLKKNLETEGIFSEERKQRIPEYPERIGVITSKTGAVIHDFLNNLGHFGYKIALFNSRVEGQSATRDILAGLTYFKNKDIDVLVIIRGGGSFESLQAFNNEIIVRTVADYPLPVVCGIGHDKDVPLVSLAADRLVSTPTAATALLNDSWQRALHRVTLAEQKITTSYLESIQRARGALDGYVYSITSYIQKIQNAFTILSSEFIWKADKVKRQIDEKKVVLQRTADALHMYMSQSIADKKRFIVQSEQLIEKANPTRLLKLGYSIVRSHNRVIRRVNDIGVGDSIETLLSEGMMTSTVDTITINNKKRYDKK